MLNRLVTLILENKDAFVESVIDRQATSTFNKGLHQDILDTIDEAGLSFALALLEPSYARPLFGVLITSKHLESDVKSELVELHKEFIGGC